MSSSFNPVLFAGPSLYGLSQSLLPLPPGIRLRPPAQRDSIARLAQREPPGVILLADGKFHHSLAVGHQELREAIESGWQIWGLASMGAIRAYEMRDLGMHGFGRVYQMFVSQDDFQDDEVALVHESVPPYRTFSEPLVHLRGAIQEFVSQKWLTSDMGDCVIADLKSRWYGERTMPLFAALVFKCAHPTHHNTLQDAIDDFDRFRVKSHDLADFLSAQPWSKAFSV